MANRRMFSKTITLSSAFLMMPPTSRLLYYDFGMAADDDGFCEYFGIMRMTEAKPDDLRVLEARGFVKIFDDKVLIIKDWKENNYIQADRYKASKYLELYKKEIKKLAQPSQTLCIQMLSNSDTQVRLGKVRLGKDRLGKDTSGEQSSPNFTLINEIIKAMIEIDPRNKTYYQNTTQRAACDFLLEEYGLEEVLRRIKLLPQFNKMPYFPSIHTPYDLKEKWKKLEEAVSREQVKLKAKEQQVIM